MADPTKEPQEPKKDELTLDELDAASGGAGASPLRAAMAGGTAGAAGGAGEPPHGGGQNDPAQMFQQILQQLTQGQD